MYHCAVLRKFEGHVACSAGLCSVAPLCKKKARGSLCLLSPCPLFPWLPSVAKGWKELDLNHLLAYGSKLGCKSLEQVTLRSLAGSQNLSCLCKSTGPQTRPFMTVSSFQAALQGIGLITSQRRKPRLREAEDMTMGGSSLLIRRCGFENPRYVRGIKAVNYVGTAS